MIIYKHPQDIQIELLCRICLKICLNPVSCYQCMSLYCLQCLDQNDQHCRSCIIYQDGIFLSGKVFILDPYSNKFLDLLKCLCQYCNSQISYKKYRNHRFNCKLLKTNFEGKDYLIQIYNSNYEVCYLSQQICEQCKNTEIRPSNCPQCKVFMTRKQDQLMKQDKQIQINKNLDVSELQFNLKFSCKRCNIFLRYAHLNDHRIKCLNNNNGSDYKKIKLLHQNIQRLNQTRCFLNTNNYYQQQNFRKLILKYQKCLKRLELIETEQNINFSNK